ncbi:MAG: hypothetical protein ACI8WB_004783, partial [Phenylobacterium sp.]
QALKFTQKFECLEFTKTGQLSCRGSAKSIVA